ncbi:FAD binding domain-containing protein [Chloroflexota bacterium]
MGNPLRNFKHVDAKTVDEAVSALGSGNAWACAGGTDLLGTMKLYILPDYPEIVVNLKTISPSLDYIKEEGGTLKIGALTRLEDIAKSSVVHDGWTALAEAAHKTASPHIREMGTIGGNICQLNRCWYFRKLNNRFDCIRKGGGLCYAMMGDNRYHSIFGGVLGCVAVNPSDTAPALVSLDATVVTSKREIAAEDFWDVRIPKSTVLDDDEIVTEIQVPAFSGKSAFVKFALRSSIDFPVVNCAAAIGGGSARICLNAVFNNPYRVTAAENSIAGKTLDIANAEAASDAAISGNVSLTMNKWKVQSAKGVVKQAILACA